MAQPGVASRAAWGRSRNHRGEGSPWNQRPNGSGAALGTKATPSATLSGWVTAWALNEQQLGDSDRVGAAPCGLIAAEPVKGRWALSLDDLPTAPVPP